MIFLVWSQSLYFAEQDIITFIEMRIGQSYRESIVTIRYIDKAFGQTFTWKNNKKNILNILVLKRVNFF